MTPRWALLAVLAVALLAVGGVQLLDPELDDQRPPEVDFSEPPAEVAADSAARLEHVDYAYRIDIADNRSGPWEQLTEVRVDRKNRRYRSLGPLGEDGSIIYANDAVTFVRPGQDARWHVGYVPETTYPAPGVTQPFNLDDLRRGTGSVVGENASIAIYDLQGAPLKVVHTTSGRSRLYIDKERKVVKRAVVAYPVGPAREEFARFRFVEYGTSVSRPEGLVYSPTELFWDILNGPFFRLT